MTRSVAVQLYTLRNELAAGREATIRKLADIGYDAVEPYRPTEDPEGMRAVLDDVGMGVWATHGRMHLEEPAAILAAARTLGTDRVIIPGGFPHEAFTSAEGVQQVAARVNELAKLAADHGMRLGYHNHWWEFSTVGGGDAYRILIDHLAPEVFLELDTYWAAVAGADVPSLQTELGDRVHSLHLKDGPLIKGEANTALGAGRMPVAEVLAAAPDDAQLIIELDKCASSMTDAVARSYTYLDKLVRSPSRA